MFARPLTSFFLVVVGGSGACDTDATAPAANDATYRAQLTATLLLGQSDNAEVVKMLPNGTQALVVASKARKLTLVDLGSGTLTARRSRTLFADDPSESETTAAVVAKDGSWAAVTRNLSARDADGQQTSGGSGAAPTSRGAKGRKTLRWLPRSRMPVTV